MNENDEKIIENEVVEKAQIIQSLSEIYTSVYYIDRAKNYYMELASVDSVHSWIGATGDAQERLNFFCHNMMTPEYTEEMLEFVDLTTLDERLGHRRIISKQYLSTVVLSPEQGDRPDWTQCSFIECDRDSEGRLAHVLFVTQSVHDLKKKEIEAKTKLKKSNYELKKMLDAEKQYISIIGALGTVFFSLQYIDLVKNTCQEIVASKSMKYTYGKTEDAGLYMKNLVDAMVAEEYRPAMYHFTDIETINERLGGKSIIIQEYYALSGDWIRCVLISAERDEKGNNVKIICGLRKVTEEKQLELNQQRKIEEALATVEKINETLTAEMEIAGTLSKDYEDVVLLDLVNDTAVTIKREGRIYAKEERVVRRSYNDTWDYYISKYVIEEDKDMLHEAVAVDVVQRELENSDEYVCTYRVRYDESGIHYFQVSFIRMYFEQEKESNIILGFRNIDAIVEEEHKHRKIQEEQLQIIGALSREYHSLFKIDADTGALSLYRTDGIGMAPELIGRLMSMDSYEQGISMYIDTYIVPEDRERIREATRLKSLIERVPDVGVYKLGYRRMMNNVYSYYEMNVVKNINEKGKIIYIMGLRDVNDEMQRQLRQARDIEAQSEIIDGLASEYYSILLVNPETDTVMTYRANEEDGQAIANHFKKHDYCWSKGIHSYSEELVSEKCRSEFVDKLSLERIRANGSEYSFTYEKLVDDGIIYLQARVAFVHEKDGRLVAVVGTRNVDDLIKKERKQEMALKAAYDAAEAASKAKTDFLSNMSHDIRTPMNGIIGMTAIAAANIDDKERVKDSLQKIAQASKHLLSLINEVLDMSKIESGKVDLAEEEFNLSDLVDNLLSMMNYQLAEHNHELTVNISGVIHEDVVGDSLRIQKVFTNLMGNAVKFTPDGGKISLTIKERPSRQLKVGCYEFIFEDNGIGMSEEFISHIFEPFARATDGRVNKIQGTGLGMPISRNIVRMMGGDISVESKLGEGSKFTVTMYLKLQDTVEVQYDRFVDLDVLVVDDDPLCLESCCDILNDFGMKAEGVSSGSKAVDCVIKHHEQDEDYFACIIDWKMPGIDGIETTRAIRKAVGNDVPIIIISAYDWSDIEQKARTAGANAFISKPLFRSRLAKTFNSLVANDEEHKDTNVESITLEDMDLSGYRALLVEDNELNAEIATELLSMTGMVVEHASDGTEAVDMILECEDGYYDIIFMDIQMPRMNGYDTTRAIRVMNRNYCRQVPIIAMSANAFAEDVQAAKTVGMNEHIAKPLELKVLVKTLKKWLR